MHFQRKLVIQKRLSVRVRVWLGLGLRIGLGLGLGLTKNDSRSFFKMIVVHFLNIIGLCVCTS